MKLVPSSFDQWASAKGFDISFAVCPDRTRVYADRRTQEAFDAWNAGASSVARMVTESTIETQPLIERMRELADSE